MANTFEFNFSEFDDLVKKVEELGLTEKEISQKVLDSATDEAINAYRSKTPYGEANEDGKHARDNINASKIKKSKNGNYYKVIGAGTPGGSGLDQDEFRYLYYLENGTNKMVARPFMDSATSAVRSATLPVMKATLEEELEKRLK